MRRKKMGEIANENTPIYKSLTFVFDNVECQKYELEKCMLLKDECEILRKIRIISNEIYSGCEMINEMLVAIYRNKVRGTQLKNGFNKNFIKVYNIYAKQEKEIPEIYRNKFVFSFYMSAKSWYVDIHDTNNNLFDYDATVTRKAAGETVAVDYYYTSEITSTSYSRKRNNLGAGWSWGFPSVEVIKDNYNDITEVAKAIYYHDGKGNTMEVKYTSGNGYSFANYVGKDITFEDFFDYDTDVCSTSRIDYIVDNPDGTKYYFGAYGELRTIMDRYGNKITFTYYDDKDFYGAENCLLIRTITDTVGRTVRFDYSDEGGTHEDITVTVTSPVAGEGSISLTYEKRMLDIERADGTFVSTEPILESVTNAIGEVTTYYPAMEQGEMKNAYSIQFTFADKSFNSEFVYNTSGYANNLVYLLGNIVRPHSNTYYYYDICERNLGHSGVSQAYRLAERGDFELVIYDDYDICENYDKNVVQYRYSRDYTGYPIYNSIESIPNNAENPVYVARTKAITDNTYITRDFHKIDNAILKRDEISRYTNPVGKTLTVSSQSTFFQKIPSRTRIEYTNDDNYTYTSYTQVLHHSNSDKAFGKPELVTEEVDFETVTTNDRDKHSVAYTYNTTTGFVTSKSWYQKEGVKCTEEYKYDNKQRISEIENAAGHTEQYTYEYNADGKVTKKTTTTANDLGTTVVEENYTSATGFAFPSTIVKTVTAIDGNEVTTVETTSYTYNMLLGVVTSETDTDGNVTYYEYDKLGRPTRIIYPSYQSYTSYNEKGQTILPVEECSYKTVIRDYGNVLASDESLVAQEIYSALSYYDITTSTESNPTNINLTEMPETFYSAEVNYYMGTGELIEKNEAELVENNAAIVTTTYYYDTEANTVKEVDAQGNTTTTYYDGLGREVKTIDRFDNYHITEYNISGDGVGFKAQSYFVPYNDRTKKENITEVTYDRLGRAVSEKAYSSYPESFVETKYTYDLAGNVIGIIDPNENLNEYGFTESYTYDRLNRVTKVKNANNELAENTYDNAGNIKTQKVSGQSLFTRYYDGAGRLVNDTDNSNNSNQYAYDAQGRCRLSLNKNGITNQVDYNAGGFADRIRFIKDYSGIIDRRYGYTNPYAPSDIYDLYWEVDNTNTVTQGVIFTMQHSEVVPSGNMGSQQTNYALYTGVDGLTLTSYSHYMYDSLGNVTSTLHGSVNDTGTVFGTDRFYSYESGRLSKVQVDGSNIKNTSDNANVKYEYYPDGKLKSISYPPLADGSIVKTEYTYDGLSRLYNLTNYKGTTVLSSYTYAYDENGNITNISEVVENTEDETNFSYDKLNRIATVSGTKGADSYYEYDERGNRKANYEQIDFLDEESVTYAYDEENNLYSAQYSDSWVEYYYNADGYRCAKFESGQIPEFYLYDEEGRLQSEIQAAYAGTQAIMYPIREYIWGPDRVLAQIDINNNIYYYLYNGHGDVVQIVDTNGNIKNRYDYDVWGNFLKKEETIENSITYFGQTYDEETGLYYLRARYYDPTTGRFTQQDPVEDGYNWYVYGNQNPVVYADSTGLFWDEIYKAALNPNVHRAVWYMGAETYLKSKEYYTSAWMLEHSLLRNPSDEYRGDFSRIAELIKNDAAFLNDLDRVIRNSDGKTLDDTVYTTFENGDLYYSIHRSTIKVTGYRMDNGKWYISGTLDDEYDYTEIMTYMGGNNATLGTIANDAAFFSQIIGAINPYHIYVDFSMIR